MKEIFLITQVFFTPVQNLDGDWQQQMQSMMPEGQDYYPELNSYPDAQQWIKNNGKKYKYYKIQKFIIPIN